jgi:hypothetical protein
MSPSEVADRLALQALVTDYAYAIDERDFDALDAIFTADAQIDYRAMGGIAGAYPEIKAWLKTALAAFPAYMHLNGNLRFRLHGDRASGTVACFNPMVLPEGLAETPGQTMFLGLWYHDDYLRTAEGWRIARRSETKSYAYNVPSAMQAML